jgi:NADH-quinone oxidoreductase subunit C/D
MKLSPREFKFEEFLQRMQDLKEKEHFDYLVTIVGEDFPKDLLGSEGGLGCIYILENTETHKRCSVKMMAKMQVCGDGMSSNGTGEMDGQTLAYIPSVSHIWRVADLLEREVYDFYGIVFLGHPDMRRLFLRNDFKGYPFRKDWKFNDEYTLEDDVEPDYGLEFYLDKDGNLQSKQNKLFGPDDYVINIGPQHPATHGVLRLQTVLNGETVKRIYPHLGYIHRAIEKMWESMSYPQTLALTDRLNYLGAMQHRHALVGVIEEGMGVELTDRIKYIRTIMDELQRLDSHLLYTSCVAQDLGALTGMLYGMRDREHVLNIMEETTGGRLIQNYYRIGGLQDDIDPNFVKNCKDLVKYLRPTIQEYMDVFGDNVITHNRLENCGPMSLEDCINYAVTGPAGRASGWKNDVRKNHPYDMYDKVEWEQCTLSGCDSMDRYLVHINEMYQSLNIIEQLIDNIPEGDFYVKQKPIIKVPEGQWYFSVEGVAGEFGVYLDSRGDKSPYRMKMRPMGLSLVGAFDPMLRGQKIADLIATCAAIDVVIPDIDR